MPAIAYQPLPTELVRSLRTGGRDAYGQLPERMRSTGGDNPCRHCLDFIPEGAGMLILAHRPFPEPQPYAETGPIFLCEEACEPWSGEGVPKIFGSSPEYLLKGYTPDLRIRYGTGRIVPAELISEYAAELLRRDDISFVDVRSARNNCFQARIMRADAATSSSRLES